MLCPGWFLCLNRGEAGVKKFEFPLEMVLETRRRREERLKKELGELARQYHEGLEDLGSLRSEQMKQCLDMLDRAVEEADGMELLLYDLYLRSLAIKIRNQEALVEDLSGQVDHKREEVIYGSKERKIVEKLREKRYEEFKTIGSRLEQAELDEIGTIKHNDRSGRNMRGLGVR